MLDIELKIGLTNISDRPGALRPNHFVKPLGPIKATIIDRKLVEIGSAEFGGIKTVKARKTFFGIGAVTDLSQLSVVDDIDATIDLFQDNVIDGLLEAGPKRVLVVFLLVVARS